jgi:shikimate kinase
MILKLKRTPGLYLVGFMGCGKTSVGPAVADELGWTFVDIDQDIEAERNISIVEIFDALGEPAFRDMETAAIRKWVRMVETGRPMVIALGGGAFAPNFDLLEEHGVTIWLDCPLDTIRERVADNSSRPLARDPARFEALYRERAAVYSKADYRVDASGAPSTVVQAILDLPIF